jgi:heptaprenyl diphosphate synthase
VRAASSDELAGIQASVKAGLGRVEEALAEAVTTADPFVHEAASYLVTAGGKRLRPTLVLIAGHTGQPDEPRLVGAAVAIELTHLSSLYHDDVMDEAELRRGERSANARFDNKVAVLTGDYLFARASEVTASLGTEATRVLARAIARLTQGQIREVRGPGPGEDPVEHYLAVLADKTGALIATACRLGGYLAGADPAVVAALTEFGERVGRAFQLGDDLLDITADAAVAGKAPAATCGPGSAPCPCSTCCAGAAPTRQAHRRPRRRPRQRRRRRRPRPAAPLTRVHRGPPHRPGRGRRRPRRLDGVPPAPSAPPSPSRRPGPGPPV